MQPCSFAFLSNAATSLLENREFQDEWLNLFVRHEIPSENREYFEKTYVKFGTQALFDVFVPWFNDPLALTYREMMKKMRLTHMVGSERYDQFNAIISNPDWDMMIKIFQISKIGFWDKELAYYTGHFNVAFHVPDDGGLSLIADNDYRYHGGLLQYLSNPQLMIVTLDLMPWTFSLVELRSWLGEDSAMVAPQSAIPIEGIKRKYWPKNGVNKTIPDAFDHWFPHGDSMDAYSKISESLLIDIRQHFDGYTKLALVKAVARYYHTAVNAHFFQRVNQSLLMEQVNYLLMSKGMMGISHGLWDIFAYQSTLENFTKVFVKRVLKE